MKNKYRLRVVAKVVADENGGFTGFVMGSSVSGLPLFKSKRSGSPENAKLMVDIWLSENGSGLWVCWD